MLEWCSSGVNSGVSHGVTVCYRHHPFALHTDDCNYSYTYTTGTSLQHLYTRGTSLRHSGTYLQHYRHHPRARHNSGDSNGDSDSQSDGYGVAVLLHCYDTVVIHRRDIPRASQCVTAIIPVPSTLMTASLPREVNPCVCERVCVCVFVTVVSHCGHTVVTLLLHCCYTVVTLL
jgi:hypothetical protein